MQFLMRKFTAADLAVILHCLPLFFIPVKDEPRLGALRKFLLMPMLWRLNGTYGVFSSFLLKML